MEEKELFFLLNICFCRYVKTFTKKGEKNNFFFLSMEDSVKYFSELNLHAIIMLFNLLT